MPGASSSAVAPVADQLVPIKTEKGPHKGVFRCSPTGRDEALASRNSNANLINCPYVGRQQMKNFDTTQRAFEYHDSGSGPQLKIVRQAVKDYKGIPL